MNTSTRALEVAIAGEHSLLINGNASGANIRTLATKLGLTFDGPSAWVDPVVMSKKIQNEILFLREVGSIQLSSALIALSGKCVIATNSDGATCFRSMFDLIHNQDLNPEEISAENILRAKAAQAERGTPNGKLLMNDMKLFMDSEARKMLEHLQPLNAEYIRLLRVAHTIADLEGKGTIDEYVMSEALAWRGNGSYHGV